MQAIKSILSRRIQLSRQTGVAAVEFAIVATIFFTLFFGVIELARVIYIFNTLQEVTRRAAERASHTDFNDTGALLEVREAAIFRTDRGNLAFAAPVTEDHVRIDYLSIIRDGSALTTAPVLSLPASPDANQQICMTDPNDARCIRMVRVRICQPGDPSKCGDVPYQPAVSFIPLHLLLPQSTTIVMAETLGRPAGLPPPPE